MKNFKTNHRTKLYSLLLAFLFAFTAPAFSQTHKTPEEEAAYTKVITQRAAKIVDKLGVSDQAKAIRVRDIIADQYRNLGHIHDSCNEQIKAIKQQAGQDKAAAEAKIKAIENSRTQQLDQLHSVYLAKLSAELTPDQVTKVKDGMTYGVLPLTYNGYLDMLPDLTAQQKNQIMDWLVEAREHAMDAGSSDKKHAWFGKYKGRINNYLSAEGYDVGKASKEWQERIKKRAAAKK